MDGDDGGEAEYPEQRERDEDRDQGEGQADVLQHDLPGAAGVIECLREGAEVFAHEGDVGGFDRYVRSHCAHGDAEVGGGQGGSVVDAVADHRGERVRSEVADDAGLVFGAEVGVYVVDAGDLRQRVGGGGVVAGEHRDRGADAVQVLDYRAGFGAKLVTDGDRADDLTVVFDQDGGGAVGLDVGDVRMVRDRVVITMTRKGYEGARGDFLLAEEVGRRLLAAIWDRTEGPALVHHTGGRIPGSAARKIVAGTAMRAGITVPVTPHALRRTFVTLGRDAGISDRDLQASTGHLTAQMIGYYDRARDSVTRDGGDQLATYLGISTGQTPAPRADPERPATLGPLNTTQLAALGRERGARARRLAADRVESVADLINQGMTLPQIAEQVGISYSRTLAIVHRYDLPESRTPAVIRREQVRVLAARGLASTAIAREVGISPDGVLAIIHRHNFPWPRPDARTPAARAARQARALVLVEEGATRREIAADLGVDISTVGRYLTGTALAQATTRTPWTPTLGRSVSGGVSGDGRARRSW